MKEIANICLVSNTLYDQGIIQNSAGLFPPNWLQHCKSSQIPV